MIDKDTLVRATQFWFDECQKLGVDIIAPYSFEVGNKSLTYLAFLPDFGGVKGTLICPMDSPKIPPDIRMQQAARERGFYVSSINVKGYANHTVSKGVFKEILCDWGYYGTKEKRPAWFADHDHSKSEK